MQGTCAAVAQRPIQTPQQGTRGNPSKSGLGLPRTLELYMRNVSVTRGNLSESGLYQPRAHDTVQENQRSTKETKLKIKGSRYLFTADVLIHLVYLPACGVIQDMYCGRHSVAAAFAAGGTRMAKSSDTAEPATTATNMMTLVPTDVLTSSGEGKSSCLHRPPP